jgi:hypothetical protein
LVLLHRPFRVDQGLLVPIPILVQDHAFVHALVVHAIHVVHVVLVYLPLHIALALVEEVAPSLHVEAYLFLMIIILSYAFLVVSVELVEVFHLVVLLA